ncbi:MAG: hypothetical protein ACM30G_14335 [Micromonosporaceae bacterium]
MPASQAQDVRRARLLAMLFWGGVGLVPLTLLIVMVGQGTGSLRVAVVFGLLSTVAIGVSITLRREAEVVRIDLEHFVFDQLDQLRADMRADVTTASRNTYHALRDKLAVLAETVETLRFTLDEALTEPPPAPTGAGGPGGPGVVHRTETVHVTRRTTTVDADLEERGTVYGSQAAGVRTDRPELERGRERGRDRHRDDDDDYDDRPRRRRSRDDDDRYEARRSRDDDRYEARRSRDDDRPEPRRLRDDDDDRPEVRRSRGARRRDLDEDDQWEGGSSGDRWTSIRDDDDGGGRQVRMRERRSSMRSDGRRREVHIEDRWAELRGDPHSDEDDADWEATFRSLRRPALPPAPGESARPYVEGASREYEHGSR